MEPLLKGIVGQPLTNRSTINLEGGITMYITGEKPGKGTYQCIACGCAIVLDDTTDTLPPCPKCHKVCYIRVGF